MRWCRAGHLPAMVRTASGQVTVLDEAGSPPIGVFEGVDFKESSATLEHGDVLVLYTDGLVERPDEGIDEGLDRFAAHLAGVEPGPGMLEAIIAPISDVERRDDVAVLVLTT